MQTRRLVTPGRGCGSPDSGSGGQRASRAGGEAGPLGPTPFCFSNSDGAQAVTLCGHGMRSLGGPPAGATEEESKGQGPMTRGHPETGRSSVLLQCLHLAKPLTLPLEPGSGVPWGSSPERS